jgi:hypothetical protein
MVCVGELRFQTCVYRGYGFGLLTYLQHVCVGLPVRRVETYGTWALCCAYINTEVHVAIATCMPFIAGHCIALPS